MQPLSVSHAIETPRLVTPRLLRTSLCLGDMNVPACGLTAGNQYSPRTNDNLVVDTRQQGGRPTRAPTEEIQMARESWTFGADREDRRK